MNLVAPAPAPVVVALRAVSKRYGNGPDAFLALQDVALDVRGGEFVCLVGASGCGKSTLLHLVAGLETPSTGAVTVPGGGVAVMFQEAALFPWLSVRENIAFPLKMRGKSRGERDDRVDELLGLVHLEAFGDRQPHELSGGMRQRVALARAIAQEARVLCMDEPFAALDAMMRDHLHEELERIWSETGLTILFVTHNPREAARLADRVLVLDSRPGRIVTEIAVPLPRPRRMDSPDVSALAAGIVDRLRELRHGRHPAAE